MELACNKLTSIAPPKPADLNEPLLKGDTEMQFCSVAGVCKTADADRIARQVFRATRGNTFTVTESIAELLYDPKEEKPVQKSTFVVYFQGAAGTSMLEKVQKTCASYGVNFYNWPASQGDASARLSKAKEAVLNKEAVKAAYESNLAADIEVLTKVTCTGGNSAIEEMLMTLEKEKQIYCALNNFKEAGTTINTECWYRESEATLIQQTLMEEAAESKSSISGLLMKIDVDPRAAGAPTYIRRNEFTAAFQELIDTYGSPGYQEANPALFACITFPFIFGIMYGDVFHGGCLFLLGIYAILNADSLKYAGDAGKALYFARYMVFLMGLFAVYC